MENDILEIVNIEEDLKDIMGIKEEPIVKKEVKKVKYVYKITNKTFQPIQLVINENEMLLLGPVKKDNIVFVKRLTKQINNLEKKGMIKIRKMN